MVERELKTTRQRSVARRYERLYWESQRRCTSLLDASSQAIAYVLDGMHHAMQIFDRRGQLLLAIGQQGRGEGEFWLPGGVFVTRDNLIFVADAYNGRVQVFRYTGAQT